MLPLPPISRHSTWFARAGGAATGWWAAVVMLYAGGGAGGGCTTWAPLVGFVDEPVDVARDTWGSWSPHLLVRHNLWFEQAVPCDAPRAVRAGSAWAGRETLRANENSRAPTDVAERAGPLSPHPLVLRHIHWLASRRRGCSGSGLTTGAAGSPAAYRTAAREKRGDRRGGPSSAEELKDPIVAIQRRLF